MPLYRPLGMICLLTLAIATAMHGLADDADGQQPDPAAPAADATPAGSGGLDPEPAADSFVTHAGTVIEAAATEPACIDPIAARFDQQGRIWIVEMRDYPTGPIDGATPAGKIRILSDNDGDGKYESAITFADQLLFPTGLQPWRNGAIVTLAGRIAYFADTDGDGRADQQQTWFTGFAEQNTQLRANHPTLGPDGLVYVAGGLRGGKVVSDDPRWPAAKHPIDVATHDFAFDPDGGYCGAVSGNSQYGLSIDDFGTRIGCSNRNPAIQALLPVSVIRRDPWLLPRDALFDAALVGPDSRVQPVARAWTTSNLHAGQFSAACGVFRACGPGLPPDWSDDLLVCEPTGYLVQRQTTRADGPRLIARRVDAPTECVASRDTWFRPVDLSCGPDGCLYIVDMYRAVIEHPDFAPVELKQRSDTWDGNDRGRLWRLRAEQGSPLPPDSWTGLSLDQLAQRLSHPNPWHRETASRLLYEQSDAGLPAAVRKVLHSDDATAAGRSRAAYLLAAEQQLNDDDVRRLLNDVDQRVRSLAVALATERTDSVALVAPLAADDSAAVRHQVAIVLGAAPADTTPPDASATADTTPTTADGDILRQRLDALLAIAQQDAGDASIATVLGAVADPFVEPLLQRMLNRDGGPAPESAALLSHLAARIGYHQPLEIASSLKQTQSAPQWSLTLIDGWQQGLARGRHGWDATLKGLPADAQQAAKAALARAQQVAVGHDVAQESRLQALRVLRYAPSSSSPKSLRDLVQANQPMPIRIAVLPLLIDRDRAWFLDWLDEELLSLPPSLRHAAVEGLIARAEGADWLLDRLADGRIPTSLIELSQADRLKKSRDPEIRKRAGELFAAAGADRQAVIQQYASAVRASGDPVKGRAVFLERCSTCHHINGEGVNVGPDISDSRTKTPEALLASILDPNAAIDAAFLRYTVLTVDGRVIDGLLVGDSTDSVTLQQQGGEAITVPRSEIEIIRTPGVSLMPDGFEQMISPEQMHDLLTYLKNWRYLDGAVPVATTP